MNTAIGKNKILTIKSSDRVGGIPSNFIVNFGQYNLNPTYCSFHQVAIPNGFFNVARNSCFLSLTIYDPGAVAYPFVISPGSGSGQFLPGNYNAGTGTGTIFTPLLTALNQAAANANSVIATAGNSFFQYTYSTTGFFTLSTTSNYSTWSFSIDANVGSLDWILGYRPYQSGLSQVSSATGVVVIDLRAPPCIYIRCSLVGGNYLSAEGTQGVVCVVQNSAGYSQTIFQRSPQPDLDLFPVTGQITQIQFQLVDEWGHELNMDSGQDWEMSIGIYSV